MLNDWQWYSILDWNAPVVAADPYTHYFPSTYAFLLFLFLNNWELVEMSSQQSTWENNQQHDKTSDYHTHTVNKHTSVSHQIYKAAKLHLFAHLISVWPYVVKLHVFAAHLKNMKFDVWVYS